MNKSKELIDKLIDRTRRMLIIGMNEYCIKCDLEHDLMTHYTDHSHVIKLSNKIIKLAKKKNWEKGRLIMGIDIKAHVFFGTEISKDYFDEDEEITLELPKNIIGDWFSDGYDEDPSQYFIILDSSNYSMYSGAQELDIEINQEDLEAAKKFLSGNNIPHNFKWYFGKRVI